MNISFCSRLHKTRTGSLIFTLILPIILKLGHILLPLFLKYLSLSRTSLAEIYMYEHMLIHININMYAYDVNVCNVLSVGICGSLDPNDRANYSCGKIKTAETM